MKTFYMTFLIEVISQFFVKYSLGSQGDSGI